MLHVLYKTCTVQNGAHTLTDKRAAHDNGHHLQSDTHTIQYIKENGLLLVEKRAGSEIRKTTTNEYYSWDWSDSFR